MFSNDHIFNKIGEGNAMSEELHPTPGIGNIIISDERMLLVEDTLGWEKARQMAADFKVKALGMMSQLFFRPKPEDITISYEERRYQAFWHVSGTSANRYKRRARYRVPTNDTVTEFEIAGHPVLVNPESKSFEIEGIETCSETLRAEYFIDAATEESGDFGKYLRFNSWEIHSTESLTTNDTFVADIQTKAPFLIRKVLTDLVKPFRADEILQEELAIEELALFFYPVYAFEFYWAAKNKQIVIELDGATGEIKKGNKLKERLKKVFTHDDIYEYAKEVANFVPGGALVVMAGKKTYEIVRNR